MVNPEVIDGKVTLTEEQYRLLVTTAAQCDYANEVGDGDCLDAAWHHAKLALKSIGEKTSEEENAEEEDEDE